MFHRYFYGICDDCNEKYYFDFIFFVKECHRSSAIFSKINCNESFQKIHRS